MACPYFLPDRPLEGPRPARAPLSDVFGGTCGIAGPVPERSILVDFCNFGYASSHCERFPAAANCDALRFSARNLGADNVEVTYVREKDWTPIESGKLIYARAAQTLTPVPADAALARQSLAFAARFPIS